MFVGLWVCSLGLHDVGWASRRPLPPSTFHGGVAVLLCSSQNAVSRLRCCLGGADHLPSLLPLSTNGDDAAETEESELGSRASGFQKKRRRRPKGVDPPLLVGHPPDKTTYESDHMGGRRTELRGRPRVCSSHRGQSCPRSQDLHAHQHFSITRV